MSETLKYYPTPDAKAVEVEVGKGSPTKLWTSREHAKVMAMVRRACANYNAEYKECMLTDGYGCILETSLHPCCNYFRDWVWGGDPSVPYDTTESKTCAQCGKSFQPGSNRAKYCPECAKKAEKEGWRKRQRKHRSNVTE